MRTPNPTPPPGARLGCQVQIVPVGSLEHHAAQAAVLSFGGTIFDWTAWSVMMVGIPVHGTVSVVLWTRDAWRTYHQFRYHMLQEFKSRPGVRYLTQRAAIRMEQELT